MNRTLTQFPGGISFFTAFDRAVRQKVYVDMLVRSTAAALQNVVVSGQFGRFLSTLYPSRFPCLLLVPGGLRGGVVEVSLDRIRALISGQAFVFLDDSYYSGSTRAAIGAALDRIGCYLEHTYVLYDGAHARAASVTGLYRYHCEFLS